MSRVSASRSSVTALPEERARACSRSPPARSTAPASSDDAFPACRRRGGARCPWLPSRELRRRRCRRRSSGPPLPMWWTGRGAAADVPTPPDAPEQGGRDGHAARARERAMRRRLGEDPKDPQGPPLGFSGHARAAAECLRPRSSCSLPSRSLAFVFTSRPDLEDADKQVDTTLDRDARADSTRATRCSRQANAPLLPRPGPAGDAGQGRRRRAPGLG